MGIYEISNAIHENKGKIVLGGLIFFASITAGQHSTRNTYDIKVNDKVVDIFGKSSRYLVFTDIINTDEQKVFENSDSWLEKKINSSDIQNKLKEEKTYRIETYGWRIPFFSMYENIVEITPIDNSK
jgi:hypothetical protein